MSRPSLQRGANGLRGAFCHWAIHGEAKRREQRRSEAVDSGEATGLILTYVPYITTAVLHGTCLRYTVVASSAAWYLYN